MNKKMNFSEAISKKKPIVLERRGSFDILYEDGSEKEMLELLISKGVVNRTGYENKPKDK